MDILKYVRSLLPSFEKNTIMEDIRMARQEIKENTLPPYETAVAHFDNTDFASRDVQKLEKEFLRAVDTRMRGNSLRIIYETLRYCQDHLDAMETLSEKEFSKDVVKDAMTYLKANILRGVDTVGFVARYSRVLLNWVLIEEAYATNSPGALPADRVLKKPELEYLNQHKDGFFHAVKVLLRPAKELEKILNDVPDMIIDNGDDSHAVAGSTVGRTRIDPLNMKLLPLSINPIYGIGLLVAEWQASRFNAAKEERRLLELRLLQLQDEYRDSPNPKLQENIEYNQERLDKLKYKMKKMEERYA